MKIGARRVVVLTGGSTPERPVAFAGAAKVVAALRGLGHRVVVADTCEGMLGREREEELLGREVGAAPPSAAEVRRLEGREDLSKVLDDPDVRDSDLVFLVLHGRQGEGGLVQTLLEMRSLLYTGSDSFGSALAMDKDVCKRLLLQAGVPTPEWRMWPVPSEELSLLGLPLVIKPSRVGSTVGLSVARDVDAVGQAVEEAMSFDREVLLERFLSGRELTVGVLADRALGVGEIVPPGEVFDFHSKYTPGIAEEIFPAEIAKALEQELQELALTAHRALKLRDFSRVDFRLDEEERPQCLEVNTLPGMTPTSLLPQSAAVVGIDFAQLCQRIVELAWERRA